MDDGPEPYLALGDTLAGLGSPARLFLLRALTAPRPLHEIEISAGLAQRGADRSGNISRQAVRMHVERLMEIGVVIAVPSNRGGRETVEYTVNHQRLYAIMEDFRDVTRVRPVAEPAGPTMPARQHADVAPAEVTSLVLTKGIGEGRTFDLSPGDRSVWRIGRRRGLEISLDFDPFLSSENSEIRWRDGRHVLADLESRNGTAVNFRLLAAGGSAALSPGDIVGVGRSLLVFRGPVIRSS